MLEGGAAVGGDQHTLAGGEAVGLDDVGGAVFVDRGDRLVVGRRPGGPAGGNAGRIHDPLGEGLAALEGGGGLVRAEDGDSGGAELVGDAGDERGLGADDNEFDLVVASVVTHDRAVGGVEGDHLDIGRDARVAGRGGDFVTRILPQ